MRVVGAKTKKSKNGGEAKSPDYLGRWLLPALALLMAQFAGIGRAEAACTPAAPVNDAIVICTGITDNQNDPAGYGTETENGLTINVESGASVTGTRFGVSVDGASGSNTINNLGTISGLDQGVLAEVATINNSGTITSSGNRGIEGNNITLTNALSGVVSGVIAMSIRDATVTNLGTITGSQNGIGLTTGTIDNSGTISAAASNGFAIVGPTSNVTNSGLIQASGVDAVGIISEALSGSVTLNNLASGVLTAGKFGIDAITANVTNAGRIESTGADGAAINAATATIANFGTIVSAGANTRAINTTGDANVTNNSGGTISGRLVGIEAAGAANVNNAQGALIEATEPTFIASAIFADGAVSVQNSGTIRAQGGSAGGIGAFGALTVNNTSTGVITATRTTIGSNSTVNVTGNDGLIETTGASSTAIFGDTKVSVSNGSGTIRALGAGSTAIIAGGTATVANGSGSIQTLGADSFTILGGTVDVTGNAGTIEATGVDSVAIRAQGIATVTSSGTIRATGAGGIGILATTANVRNLGTISGGTGIQATNPSAITNSGTIEGTGGTAIRLGPGADTLTLLPGSQIIGAVDMGGGEDTVNLVSGAITLTSRVSSFFKLLKTNLPDLPNLINFTGTLNTIANIVNPNGLPTAQSADGVAILDPTAFGQEDRTLMDFTGGVASLVQGRLGGTAANVSGMQVVSFAPTLASDRTNEAFAAISAMAYGPERSRMAGKAPAAGYAPYAAPYNVWASGFGGARTQKGDDLTLRSTSSAWGGVIGIDRRVRSDLLLGAFAGGGTGRLSVDLSSQSVDTDYFVGGVYGRFDWVTHFLDFTLQAGGIHNKSTRLVLNDLAPGGSENAAASYNGWYISPELAYGLRYGFGNGYTVTPVARLRYFSGVLDGYSETGSEQNLVVGRRTLQNLEERAEIELSKITGFSAGAFKTSVHGGVIALQRLGSPTINTVLIGQDLSFTTPGEDSAVGVVAGAGFYVRTSANMSLFGAFEGTVMSDNSRTVAAKGGLRIAF